MARFLWPAFWILAGGICLWISRGNPLGLSEAATARWFGVFDAILLCSLVHGLGSLPLRYCRGIGLGLAFLLCNWGASGLLLWISHDDTTIYPQSRFGIRLGLLLFGLLVAYLLAVKMKGKEVEAKKADTAVPPVD